MNEMLGISRSIGDDSSPLLVIAEKLRAKVINIFQ